MSLGDWLRRLFSPSTGSAEPGDAATLREEYGEDPLGERPPGAVAGGPPGLAGFEDAEAAEDAVESDEPPSDPTA